MMKSNLSKIKNLIKYQKFNIAQGASYHSDSSKVKIRGKFLKSSKKDMPTMLFFPEALESAETYEKFFNENSDILNYRNVWILYPRNFGDSDHHNSFCLNESAHDINRFIEEKKLSTVTVGGHGYGAKVACAFSTQYMEKTSGVICVEGGPIDQSYHPAWNAIREYIIKSHDETKSTTNLGDAQRKVDKVVSDKYWNKLIKSNMFESNGSISWKMNMPDLYYNVKRQFSDLTRWDSRFGLFPGRAFCQFASHSNHIYLNTNTIPFYKFFPHLEGKFPSPSFNFITTDEGEDNHWLFNYKDKEVVRKLASRMTHFVNHIDGTHVLLSGRDELGVKAIEERYTRIGENIRFTTEYIPEHLHHNYKHTEAYKDSKKNRGVQAASTGEFSKGLSNEKYW